MIGVKYWADRSRYHIQDNNSIESIIKKKNNSNHFLETCGPTTAANCLDAMGLLPGITMPGGYQPQHEDMLTIYMNDPLNDFKLRKSRPDLDPELFLNNEIPQDYPLAVREVFGQNCVFQMGITHDQVMQFIITGKAVQLCLKNPGHFIAIVAFDVKNGDLYMNDPWPERWPNADGFNRILTVEDFATNIEPYAVIYG